MASGRVGGTKSKIRGQVGNVVYQVKRNDDGTYTQISYGKAEDVTQTITPRLQAQRMCTSMVEALMRDLKVVGRISMQSAANKSKSLNAFSSYNLQLVARDCKAFWYGGGKFHYPPTTFIGDSYEALGGAWMLSSGTWQYNGFDELKFTNEPTRLFPYAQYFGCEFAGLRFRLNSQPETVADFLNRHYMTVLDTIVFAAFHDWTDDESDPDDPKYMTQHTYIMATINPAIDVNALMTPELIADLFIFESNWDVFRRIAEGGQDYYFGLMIDTKHFESRLLSYGAFTISYLEGKKKISSSSLQLVADNWSGYYYNYAPADVFGSWMGTPYMKPYPNIFDT